jgi:hypothetical protein
MIAAICTAFELLSQSPKMAVADITICTTPSAEGRRPNDVDFLAGGIAGRAKLLLSRIPAASAAPIPAAP